MILNLNNHKSEVAVNTEPESPIIEKTIEAETEVKNIEVEEEDDDEEDEIKSIEIEKTECKIETLDIPDDVNDYLNEKRAEPKEEEEDSDLEKAEETEEIDSGTKLNLNVLFPTQMPLSSEQCVYTV
jgi:hypothetical protein